MQRENIFKMLEGKKKKNPVNQECNIQESSISKMKEKLGLPLLRDFITIRLAYKKCQNRILC
jgi:hypothetical protein